MAGTPQKDSRRAAKQLNGVRLARGEFALSKRVRDEIRCRDKVEKQARGAMIRIR
jgi:hypothetical protein